LAKQVAARTHPDLHVLTVREDRKEIAVEDVRALRVALAQHAFSGRARVALIDPADRLNDEGQNALLKTLEEPGAATFLLLATSRPEGLLPTVRSRVARYRVRPLPADLLARALGTTRPSAEAGARAWAARLADGALGFAHVLLDDPAARALHAQVAEFVAGRSNDPYVLTEACLAGVSGRDAVGERMRLVLCLVRLCVAADMRQDPQDFLARHGGQAYGARLDRWIESCERAFEAEVDLQQHVAAEQTLLGLLLELAVAP
jgi:DNA polymerase-3 subunit delta'